ncbi:hypothetical protein Emag_006756 [Eimeria magna]
MYSWLRGRRLSPLGLKFQQEGSSSTKGAEESAAVLSCCYNGRLSRFRSLHRSSSSSSSSSNSSNNNGLIDLQPLGAAADAFGPYVARVARLLLLYRSLTFLELRDLLPAPLNNSSSAAGLVKASAAAAKTTAAAAQQQQGREEEYCRLRNALLVLLQHNLLSCSPVSSGGPPTAIPAAAASAATTAAAAAGATAAAAESAAAAEQHQPASRPGSSSTVNSSSNTFRLPVTATASDATAATPSAAASAAAAPAAAVPHGGVRYSLCVGAALALLRFPALAAVTGETLGGNARLLLLQIFKAGRICMQDAVALALADPCLRLLPLPLRPTPLLHLVPLLLRRLHFLCLVLLQLPFAALLLDYCMRVALISAAAAAGAADANGDESGTSLSAHQAQQRQQELQRCFLQLVSNAYVTQCEPPMPSVQQQQQQQQQQLQQQGRKRKAEAKPAVRKLPAKTADVPAYTAEDSDADGDDDGEALPGFLLTMLEDSDPAAKARKTGPPSGGSSSNSSSFAASRQMHKQQQLLDSMITRLQQQRIPFKVNIPLISLLLCKKVCCAGCCCCRCFLLLHVLPLDLMLLLQLYVLLLYPTAALPAILLSRMPPLLPLLDWFSDASCAAALTAARAMAVVGELTAVKQFVLARVGDTRLVRAAVTALLHAVRLRPQQQQQQRGDDEWQQPSGKLDVHSKAAVTSELQQQQQQQQQGGGGASKVSVQKTQLIRLLDGLAKHPDRLLATMMKDGQAAYRLDWKQLRSLMQRRVVCEWVTKGFKQWFHAAGKRQPACGGGSLEQQRAPLQQRKFTLMSKWKAFGWLDCFDLWSDGKSHRDSGMHSSSSSSTSSNSSTTGAEAAMKARAAAAARAAEGSNDMSDAMGVVQDRLPASCSALASKHALVISCSLEETQQQVRDLLLRSAMNLLERKRTESRHLSELRCRTQCLSTWEVQQQRLREAAEDVLDSNILGLGEPLAILMEW